MKNQLFIMLMFILLSTISNAHDNHLHSEEKPVVLHSKNSKITYLGNEALLIEADSQKFLFDPFFSHDFGIYQLVPSTIVNAMKKGEPPFNDVTAVFISHAHRDHFDAMTMVSYLNRFPDTALYASKQAVEQVIMFAQQRKISLSNQLISVSLNFGDLPWQKQNADYYVDAVRIPHAGWPARADVENLLFSIKLKNGDTIMHMGDADPDDTHYLPFYKHWQTMELDINFPPYWFFMSAEGRDILQGIGANENIGIHVPIVAPKNLIKTGAKYFNQPGEVHHIK